MLFDLFDLHQGQTEPLKRFLAIYNNMTIYVDEPNEKFFVAAFLKGMHTRTFSEAIFLQKPTTMDEIRTHAEKHINVKEATTS